MNLILDALKYFISLFILHNFIISPGVELINVWKICWNCVKMVLFKQYQRLECYVRDNELLV